MVFYKFDIILEVNIVAAEKQAHLITILVFYKLPLPSTLLLPPLPYRCSGVPGRHPLLWRHDSACTAKLIFI